MPRQAIIDHIPGLRRYARALTGDAWAADDLVQDTLERACSRWRLWTVGTDLRAWLFTIMHNLFANQVRGVVRKEAVARLVDIDDVASELVAESDASDTVLDLQRCLLQLPEDQRAVLLLVTLEDMPYAEVARVLDVPVGTVMSRLSRARARLRVLMDGAAAPAGADAAVGSPTGTAPAEGESRPAVPVLRRLK